MPIGVAKATRQLSFWSGIDSIRMYVSHPFHGTSDTTYDCTILSVDTFSQILCKNER